MSEDTSPCSSTLSYASPECEHRRMPQQLPSWVRFSEVRSGPAQGRPFIPLDALRRYLKRARWSVGIEESPESRDWKGVGDPALADLGRQCTFMRKTIAMDSEHVKACERERSLLESLGQSRHRHIFSILLFVGQLGCAIPLGTYKPLHKGSPEILGKQDRGFIPDSLHMVGYPYLSVEDISLTDSGITSAHTTLSSATRARAFRAIGFDIRGVGNNDLSLP